MNVQQIVEPVLIHINPLHMSVTKLHTHIRRHHPFILAF